MYKIGEFSKITQLTIKTLRYYDQEGMLKASAYLENGYRLYSNADFEKAMRIVLLRELDFSIQEIKDVLANVETNEDLQFFFNEKKAIVKEKIKKQKQLVKKLDAYLLPNIIEGEKEMLYQIDIKEYAEELVATTRFVGKYQEVGSYFSKIYKFIKSNASGDVPFVSYHDESFKDEADIEVCVPVKKITAGTNEITVKTLPKIKALVTTHIGPYENLNLAYKAILDYAKDNDIEIEFPSREKYIKGPGVALKGNPNKYETEIIIPIKE